MKLNLGCGGFPKEGFTNYDIIAYPGVVQRDLTKPLPEADNTVDFIFSEHFIEHLEYGQGVVLFHECYRILKPGGKLQVVMPDLRRLASAYTLNDIDLVKSIGLWEPNERSMCRFLNQAMRAWGHKFLWDTTELMDTLARVGFSSSKMTHVPLESRLGNRRLPTDLAIEVAK